MSADAVPPDGDAQDRIWLRMVADNQSEQALTELFKRHRKMLLRVLVRSGATKSNAEDVVQDTFIKVMRSASTFEGRSQVSSWLVTIAIRLHISALRRTCKEDLRDDTFWEGFVDRLVVSSTSSDPVQGRKPMAASTSWLVDSPTRNDPVQVLTQSAYDECCRRQYSSFANEHPQMAEALELATSDDKLSGKEIAALLGRTETATRAFLTSCRKKLRRFLEPCGDLRREVNTP